MKKISKILILTLLVSLLAGCGNNDKEPTEQIESETISTESTSDDTQEVETDEIVTDSEETTTENKEDENTIRENGTFKDDDSLNENEKKHYKNIIINAVINLDMEVLKEYLSESDYDAFEEINEHPDYKKMYQNTIGKIIYLEDSDKVLAINVNQAASSWYTECWKNNAELPKKVSDLTCEEINDIYEKHYKNSGYIMSNIEKRDLKYKFKEGKLIYDVDEIFSCVGYPDIHEKLAPGWNEYENYCNYIFGDSTNLYTNNGYEIINKDNDFPDWEMYFLPTLDEFIKYYESDANAENADKEGIFYKHFKAYIIDGPQKDIIENWIKENVLFLRNDSYVLCLMKVNSLNTNTYPYYTLTDEEKELIKDLPLYVYDNIFDFTQPEDKLNIFYDVIEELVHLEIIDEIEVN
jgi:hypothetical protein